MRTRQTIFLSAIALVSAALTSSNSFAQSSSASSSPTTIAVEFGIRQSGGGECVGKGVCDCVATGPGTSVTFSTAASTSTTSAGLLIMSFSMLDLKNNQPEQVDNFSSGSYQFDASYPLSSQLFAPLNLPANAVITPNSNTTVNIDGDNVTVYIAYSTSVN